MRLGDFVPPIILSLAKRSKLYGSYETALAVCKRGYEDDDLVSVVYEKTRLYRDSLLTQRPISSEITLFRTLIGLSLASRGNELKVIDFGGACGIHYFLSMFLSKHVFGERVNLRWHVVETPKMVS